MTLVGQLCKIMCIQLCLDMHHNMTSWFAASGVKEVILRSSLVSNCGPAQLEQSILNEVRSFFQICIYLNTVMVTGLLELIAIASTSPVCSAEWTQNTFLQTRYLVSIIRKQTKTKQKRNKKKKKTANKQNKKENTGSESLKTKNTDIFLDY